MKEIFTFKDIIQYQIRVVGILEFQSKKDNKLTKAQYNRLLINHNQNTSIFKNIIKLKKNQINKFYNNGESAKVHKVLLELAPFVIEYSSSNIHCIKDENNHSRLIESNYGLFAEIIEFIKWYNNNHFLYEPDEFKLDHIKILLEYYSNISQKINDKTGLDNFSTLNNSVIVDSFIQNLQQRVITDIEKFKLNKQNYKEDLKGYYEKANYLLNEFELIFKKLIRKDKPIIGYYLLIEPLKLLADKEKDICIQKNDKDANTVKSELTLRQIALKYFYEGNQITRKNHNNIAAQYGYTSGEKLFQHYSKYSSRANRTGRPTLCTPKKLKNKIGLFEKVIDLLSESDKKRAIDELNILKRIYESEYQ